MSFAPPTESRTVDPLDREAILRQVDRCPRLPSLKRIGASLRELLDADHRYLAQVSDLIRRDPSLTAHVTQLVNSAFFGLNHKVATVEEAVFHLGIRRVRQLAMTTPVVDDFQKLAGRGRFHWRGFWQHCLATALITREMTRWAGDDVSEYVYVAGLLHDVGRIVLSTQFPDHFSAITEAIRVEGGDPRDHERRLLGMCHAELGALYLEAHSLPEALVDAARNHHSPEASEHQPLVVAAVSVANLLTHFGRLGESGNPAVVRRDTWLHSTGWQMLATANPAMDLTVLERDLIRLVDRLGPFLEYAV